MMTIFALIAAGAATIFIISWTQSNLSTPTRVMSLPLGMGQASGDQQTVLPPFIGADWSARG